jgi:hypothetical protein
MNTSPAIPPPLPPPPRRPSQLKHYASSVALPPLFDVQDGVNTIRSLVTEGRFYHFPATFAPTVVEKWHTKMLPRLECLIQRALKDPEETISIDLVAISETQKKARPTIFVSCSSVAKVKTILARCFRFDESVFDLKVRRDKIRRSKLSPNGPRELLQSTIYDDPGDVEDGPITPVSPENTLGMLRHIAGTILVTEIFFGGRGPAVAHTCHEKCQLRCQCHQYCQEAYALIQPKDFNGFIQLLSATLLFWY